MRNKPRYEVVRSDAGWFARFMASNGRQVWRTSETYTKRSGARRAVELIAGVPLQAVSLEVRELDERASA